MPKTCSITSFKTPSITHFNPKEKRQEIRDYFINTYELYESLFSLITSSEAYYKKAEPLRHPLIFYLGHPAVFYINKLFLGHYISKRINPKFESIFAVGVDEMSWDDLNDAHYDWPTVDEVMAYRQSVKSCVLQQIDTLPLGQSISWNDPFWIILMGIEHDRIHLETSSVIMRQLPLEDLQANETWASCNFYGKAPQNFLQPVSKQLVKQGKSTQDDFYAWDNEYGSASHQVEAFNSSTFLVCNNEFLEFVEAKGYEKPEYWNKEGQDWLAYTKAKMPRFWQKTEKGTYCLRLLAETINMPWDWPVEVNYLEAKAFCNWLSEKESKSLRLPTESEWLALIQSEGPQESYPSWKKACGNINLEYWASSCPVNQFKQGRFYDLIGNVWQWTESPIDGLDGFKVHPLYDDFSTPTFDSKHNLIKGGSWISTGNEALLSSRYAFRRHFYQHAGFRYVESSYSPSVVKKIHEKDVTVAKQLHAHYGPNLFSTPNYFVELAQLCYQSSLPVKLSKALEIGCGVGRCSFELARQFKEVIGLDRTARFIQRASQLQQKEALSYSLPLEGQLEEHFQLNLEDFKLNEEVMSKCHFQQADPLNLFDYLKDFDLILANGVLENIAKPKDFLATIHQRLNPKGLLVLSSSYQWQESITNNKDLLGGYRENGEAIKSFDTVTKCLTPQFELLKQPIFLNAISKKTQQLFEHVVYEVSIWQKK